MACWRGLVLAAGNSGVREHTRRRTSLPAGGSAVTAAYPPCALMMRLRHPVQADGVGGCFEAALGDATRGLPEATRLTRRQRGSDFTLPSPSVSHCHPPWLLAPPLSSCWWRA